MSRGRDLDRLYAILDNLRERLGGFRYLSDCSSRSGWPKRGVYFFFEETEARQTGDALRVVRVGTHALRRGSRTTLWNRLSQHRGHLSGSFAGGGNHRGSIFRLHVGTALLDREPMTFPEPIHRTWAKGSTAPREVRLGEHILETAVSSYIGGMPILWIEVPDEPGPASHRGLIESNCIGLLSNLGREPLDPASSKWLGRHAASPKIRGSGMWNVNHVEQDHEPAVLDLLDSYARSMATPT